MGMYDDIVTGVSENIEIMGYPFFAENINSDEPFNRREMTFKPILNGTLSAKRGRYIQRKFSFRTTLYHKNGRPDMHDKILAEISSKPVQIVSPAMGGTFKGIVTFSKDIEEGSPYHTSYDVDILELPDKKSRIPGENVLVVPNVKKVSTTKTVNKTNSLNNKTNQKLNTSLKKCNVPYRKGQKNQCVKLLQEKLIGLGFLNKKNKTGIYDNKTIEAVKSYQRSTNGVLLVDGIFGKYTRASILKS